MKLHGRIVAGNSNEKTITIECPGGVSGVTMGTHVVIQDDYSSVYPYADKPVERKPAKSLEEAFEEFFDENGMLKV